MKKIMIVVVLIAATVCLNACKEAKACWKVTTIQKMVIGGEETSTTTLVEYVYGVESEVQAYVKQVQKTSATVPGATITGEASYEKTDMSESDCYGSSMNIENEEFGGFLDF